MKRRRTGRMTGIAKDYVGAGMTLGIGSIVNEKIGGPSAITSSYSTMASMMPVMTTAQMGIHTMKMFRRMKR